MSSIWDFSAYLRRADWWKKYKCISIVPFVRNENNERLQNRHFELFFSNRFSGYGVSQLSELSHCVRK